MMKGPMKTINLFDWAKDMKELIRAELQNCHEEQLGLISNIIEEHLPTSLYQINNLYASYSTILEQQASCEVVPKKETLREHITRVVLSGMISYMLTVIDDDDLLKESIINEEEEK